MALSINQFYFTIFMEIIIYRRRFTRWGVDGTLVIKGTKVCNTIEHPERFLPAGDYEIAFVSIANKSRKMPVILRKGRLCGKWVLILLVSNPVMDRCRWKTAASFWVRLQPQGW